MKRYTDFDIAAFKLQIVHLKLLATLRARESQTPILILARDVSNDNLVFSLYLKSPIDKHFTLLKLFYKLEDFCAWYVSRHPYREFELINYSEV